MTTDDAARDRPDWDEIHGFTSPGEYARFARWLGEAVSEGAFVEIDVAERYSGSSIFDERWFRTPAGQVWRVVAPDFPFTGVSGESTWAPTDDRGVNGLQEVTPPGSPKPWSRSQAGPSRCCASGRRRLGRHWRAEDQRPPTQADAHRELSSNLAHADD